MMITCRVPLRGFGVILLGPEHMMITFVYISFFSFVFCQTWKVPAHNSLSLIFKEFKIIYR